MVCRREPEPEPYIKTKTCWKYLRKTEKDKEYQRKECCVNFEENIKEKNKSGEIVWIIRSYYFRDRKLRIYNYILIIIIWKRFNLNSIKCPEELSYIDTNSGIKSFNSPNRYIFDWVATWSAIFLSQLRIYVFMLK